MKTHPTRESPRQQKKRFKIRHQKAYRKKLAHVRRLQGRNIIFQILHTIHTCFPDLFDRLRDIEDVRKKDSEYEQAELVVACIAMFLFKEGSRNAMNNDRDDGKFRKNYETLFRMRLPHMDTVDVVMRRLEPEELEALKRTLVRTLLTKRTLHKFRLLGEWFEVAVDATGVASFTERHCEHCLTKVTKNGVVTYFHNVLEAKLVCSNGFSISLETEWIENPSGPFTKQDCELKAFKRLAARMKQHFPRLPICIAADGLYPNAPFFEICRQYGWRFIVTFEEGNLPTVWEQVNAFRAAGSLDRDEERFQQGNTVYTLQYAWCAAVPYCGHRLQWFECFRIQEVIGDRLEFKRFVYLTDLRVDGANIAEMVRAGRLRWKIENEGFNTQKNLGYNLKHKYSRCSWQAGKNYYQCLQIGHLMNQLVELSEQAKRLLTGKKTLKHLWKQLIGLLTYDSVSNADIDVLEQMRTQMRFE